MKRITVLLAAAALFVVANAAMAGDYHVGRSLICSDCHIAHASQKHGYTSDADTTGIDATPHEKLLRGETINNACLKCHDGQSNIPDVLQDPTDVVTDGRSAGALNVPNGGAHGVSQSANYSQGDGHTLWASNPPGYVAPANPTPPLVSAAGLECTDCHGAHGNKYFRNMMGAASTSTATYFNDAWKGTEVTYQIGGAIANPPANWVYETTANNYSNDNVHYLEVNQTTSMYGQWCSTCHKNFHGGAEAGSPVYDGTDFVRHPTQAVDIGSSIYSQWANTDPMHRLKVMTVNHDWDADTTTIRTNLTTDQTFTPSCFSCHKSHGNTNKFGLIFVLPLKPSDVDSKGVKIAGLPAGMSEPARTGMSEEGDGGQYRDMCRNCHGMGSWPNGNPTNIAPF